MVKIYPKHLKPGILALFLLTMLAACKKDNSKNTTPGPTPFATIGLYEQSQDIYRRIYVAITQIGSTSVNYGLVFDTGSSGLAIDGNGILPASMISTSGIVVPGDSVVVNGITVTSKQGEIAFGDAQEEVAEYGNLAYATVKVGDATGSITTSRIPIFLYYKVQDLLTGQVLAAHYNDVFGVGPGVSYANSAIASPLSYFATKNGVTAGFKLATLNSSDFSLSGTLVSNLLTIGLVPSDELSSSGFILHPLTYYSQGGYSSDIPSTVTVNGKNIPATVVFDTGTPAISLIEDPTAKVDTATLPSKTPVTVTTNNGFTYTYTTGTNNITQITRPSYTGDPRTVFGINFFVSNEFLMDYVNHEIGLKNN